MTYTVIADERDDTGECPLWHPDERALYWTDIPAGRVYRYDPDAGTHQCVYAGRPVGGMTLEADGALLLFRDRGNVVRFKDGDYRGTVLEHLHDLKDTRWNDVISDPRGRVFAGTISTDALPGRLYRLDPDGEGGVTPRVILEDQGTPNGMAFSPDDGTFYYQDSRRATLYAFDYDADTGDLSNQRVLRAARDHGDRGRGDGLTCDASGNLWSGRYEGGCVLRCDASGVPEHAYDLPAANVTSLCFIGDALDTLVVTTASGPQRPEAGEWAGALFRVDGVDATGQAEHRSALAST